MATRTYYVTVRDDSGRTGFLLGPFRSHEEALRNVERGKALALKADPFGCFYAYGTSSLPVEMRVAKTVFGS